MLWSVMSEQLSLSNDLKNKVLGFQYVKDDGSIDLDKYRVDSGGDCGRDVFEDNFRHFLVTQDGFEVVLDTFMLEGISQKESEMVVIPWIKVKNLVQPNLISNLGL
jgi:hypothetical protein